MEDELNIHSFPEEYIFQNIIENLNSSSIEKKENSDSSHLEKKHRRSRHCKEGRKFKCENCEKSYLSQPALLNHMFNKHPEIIKENKINKRKRGRPKKFEIVQKIKEEKIIKNYNSFFQSPIRALKQNEIICDNYEKVVFIVFQIYKDYSPRKFFRCFKEPKENPILNNLINKKNLFFPICDDIFSEYLMEFHKVTN